MSIICKKSDRFFCFRDEKCEVCNIKEIEKMDQMVPKQRTVGELITILQQYPSDTKLTGIAKNQITDLITIQGNCPHGNLDNVMICYYTHDGFI